MKYLAIIFTLIIGLSAGEVTAQDYLFRVLANKGANQVKKSGSSTPEQLKTGSKLYSGDQIIASSEAYIGLVYKSGKTIEIRTPGTHKVDDLVGNVSKGSAGVTGRYMNFVMNKMNESDGDVNLNYRRNLNATGAVERATGVYELALLMKDAKSPNKVFGERTIIRWAGGEDDDSYIVTVKNAFSETLYEVETADRKIELDFTSDKLKAEKFLIVGVRSVNSESIKSQDYGIQRMTPAEAEEVKSGLTALEGEMEEGSSLNSLLYASFYEEKNLYLDALTQYETAISENPEIEDFQALYVQFVEENGLGN